MRVPASWFTEPAVVEAYEGDGAYGPVYAGPVTLLCHVDSRRVLTRNAEGDEVTGEQTLRFGPDAQGRIAPESRVNVHGRPAQVLTVKPFTVRGAVVYVEATTT